MFSRYICCCSFFYLLSDLIAFCSDIFQVTSHISSDDSKQEYPVQEPLLVHAETEDKPRPLIVNVADVESEPKESFVSSGTDEPSATQGSSVPEGSSLIEGSSATEKSLVTEEEEEEEEKEEKDSASSSEKKGIYCLRHLRDLS